jgi:hypothetical protein
MPIAIIAPEEVQFSRESARDGNWGKQDGVG